MGKGFMFDVKKCCGCHACSVACMDQNDTEIKPNGDDGGIFRHIYTNETGIYPDTKVDYISFACMHCEDAPCVMGCPTGALSRDPATSAVTIRKELCIGCHSCSIACHFGIPRFSTSGKMYKCELCGVRLQFGLELPCVRACVSGALSFGDINEGAKAKEAAAAQKVLTSGIS